MILNIFKTLFVLLYNYFYDYFLSLKIEGSGRLFEWVDGPLVNAMKEGQIFLADEISLADDSVLERLNSLLGKPLFLKFYVYIIHYIYIRSYI